MKSHGHGLFELKNFAHIGCGVVIEQGVLAFHPENIEIGDNVYIGHNTILKGYYKNKMTLGHSTWIGQQCFFHSAGGLTIGNNVGIGPAVKIITSYHDAIDYTQPIINTPLVFESVSIEDNCDIGTGSIILPNVCIGKGTLIGAGSIVTKNIPAFSVAVGNPARVIKMRHKTIKEFPNHVQ